jgi:hypothetical protein
MQIMTRNSKSEAIRGKRVEEPKCEGGLVGDDGKGMRCQK